MLRYMTAGESHGKAEIVILDGMPAGLKIDTASIDAELKKRMHGYGRGGRMLIEEDKADIISGLRKGITIGSPIAVLIKNKDHKIDELPDVFCPRPGHADLTGVLKYGTSDCRDILERASARESVSKVAMGALAKLLLKELNIEILSHVIELGGIKADPDGLSFEDILKKTDISVSRLRCADAGSEELMCKKIDEAQAKGDTLGGVFEVIVKGVPAGLGSYTQWDERLDGILGRALLSVPAVKAVSIGDGIESASKWGSQVHDPISYVPEAKEYNRRTNHAGGLEGGMTNSMDIVLRGYMKPIATLKTPLDTVDIRSKNKTKASTERSDVTAVPACGVIAENVVAFEIASCVKKKFGGDSMTEIKRNLDSYLKYIKTEM